MTDYVQTGEHNGSMIVEIKFNIDQQGVELTDQEKKMREHVETSYQNSVDHALEAERLEKAALTLKKEAANSKAQGDVWASRLKESLTKRLQVVAKPEREHWERV
jgi:hypothetical protein